MPRTYDFSEERIRTNEELAAEIARNSALSVAELDELLPRPIDRQRLKQLIEIVNSSESQNRKLARLREGFDEMGGVVLKLLPLLI